MPAWVVPAAIAAGGAIINSFSNWRARKINENYVKSNNEYNSPKSQMQRYQAAGLNPHLVYSQGNPGNQSGPLSAPDRRTGSDVAASYNQSSVSQSQVAAQEANVGRTEALTEVAKLQAEVLRRNPYLNEKAFDAIIGSLISAAKVKESDADIRKNDKFYSDATRQLQANKIFKEVELLEQRFELGNLDKQIKAEVLNSKEFENAILEIRKKFLADGDVGPQQIMQFIMLMLTKAGSL